MKINVAMEVFSVLEVAAKSANMKHDPNHTGIRREMYSKKNDYVVLIVEATLALYYQLRNATSRPTIAISFCSYYHAITGRSCTGTALRFIDSLVDELASDLPWFQSGTGWIDVLDGLYSNTKRVIKSALGDKLAKVFNHVVAISLYDKAGIPLDPVLFGNIEKKHIRPTVWNVASFVDAIVGLVLFLCKAGRQAMMTGSVECFFIDDMVLTNWLDKAAKLRKDAEFMNNPSAVGMALPQFLHELAESIALGKKLLPHFKTGREHSTLMNVLLELEAVQKRQQVTMMAATFRRAPVGVFLYGTAGVAKSFIATGLLNHYCSVRGISKEAATLWTRTENDDYYSGYKSHFAGVLYDDAAKYRANVVQGVDPSIGDIISAINNVQFVTPQADLPDKGKIPFRAEWVGVTSNLEDLNADLYFNSSAAFLRRFAVRIQPIVKEEFRVPGQDRIDTSKIPPGVQYPNLWDFRVCLPKVNGMHGQFVPHATYTTYADLLEYMTSVYQKHIAQQDKLMETVGKIGPEPLCDCMLPQSICRCSSAETGEILFGSFSATPQSGEVCTKRHTRRLGALSGHKHALYHRYTDKVMRAWIEDVYSNPEVAQWFNPAFCDPSVAATDDQIIARVNAHVDGAMLEFLGMDPRDRMNALSDGSFSRVDDYPDLTYLTFEPRFGDRGHFLEGQLHNLRETVMTFCGTLSAKEQALLDVYIQEEAPVHISNGWPMGDIVKGGYDYVKFYSKAVEDPDRTEVREFLLGTRKRYWYERLGVSLAVAYFERRWVYNTLNCLSTLPFVQGLVVWAVKTATRDPTSDLANAGRVYDARLGGNNKVVRSILLAMTLVGVVALVAKMANMFRSKPKHEIEDDALSIDCNCSVVEEDMPDQQMDLDAVGRLPTVRNDEKHNVWTVKERAITRLDVDVRRPHNEDQIVSALRNNVVFARVYGMLPLGRGKANTRVLVIDSETFVINNHALPKDCSIEMWLGPVLEEGVKPSYVVEVDERMVTRHPDRDIAIVKTWAMPHRFKDVKHLLTKRTYQSVGASAYYIRHKDNSLETLPCVGVTLSGLCGLAGAENVVCAAWSTKPTRPTASGECGSPLVIHSTLGSVVVGIHAGYNALTNTAWAVRIYREDFDNDRHPEIGIIAPAYPVAQVGNFLNLGPQDKLYTDYHKEGHLMTHGQLKSFVARPKFTGTYTPYAQFVFEHGGMFEPAIVDNMAAPRSAGWKQPQMVLENYLHPTHSMKEMVMRACVQAYCEHIEAGLSATDLEDIHPVPIAVAVNGYPGVPNVDAQKHATSAGHGKRGPKLQFLTEPEQHDVWDSFRKFDEPTLAEVDAMREKLIRGERPHAIYDACWKNEMLSKEKVAAGKARSIYMCPLAFLTNIRMSTMALCRVMIRKRDLLGIAVGLNTHSEEWDDVFRLAQVIPGDNWIAGDFKAFEAVLNLLISNSACKVFLHMARLSGNFSEDEFMAFRVMLADISNATINFFGELVTLLGGEASGHQLTTFFNCVCNNLLHMYAYVVIHKQGDEYSEYLSLASEFFTMVFRNTLGDDVYIKVHPDKPRYNHTNIQEVFRGVGIEYTMAEKGAASRPYIPLEDVTFLKRRFVDHSAFIGMKVAALDRRSIYKMMCYTVPSHSSSPEEQLAASLASAQAEAFFHDHTFFTQIAWLIDALPKTPELRHRMRQNPPPTWNGMVARFVKASPKLQVRMLVPDDVETTQTEHSYCHVSTLELQTHWSVDAWGSTTMGQYPEDRIYGGVRLSAKIVPTDGAFEMTPDPDNTDFTKNFYKQDKKSPTTAERELAPKVVAQAINKVRTQCRHRKRREKWSGVAQADIVYDAVSMPSHAVNTSDDVVYEQVVFKNEPQGVSITTNGRSDSLASSMKLPQELASYLSRPKLIFQYAWTENGANGNKTDFNPWQLFFADINMASKLNGFGMMRSKLKVKFLINGSPFYYGSMMAAYMPLSGWRTDTSLGTSVATTLTPMSQKPHVWLENQNCSTAELELPFLYPYPYIDILSSQNLADLGKINLVQFAPLLSANGTSSTSVDIQVYAWAEDVMLSGPTNLPIIQSEFLHDKQISKTASAVAAAAGKLSKVPVLGPYAKATEMAASSLGSVASFLGFTNVPNVADVAPMKQVPFSLASTEISEPIAKLSLQAKQETTIGAEQHGGPACDELAFNSFLTRSSFVVGTTWNTTAPPGEALFTTAVSPQMFARSATQIAHTPASYAANFFQYWRGSIKYTFKVVRSPYHRGRLQISWDAMCASLASAASLGNPNTITTIMDLDEDSECSFVVPYMQPELFQKTYPINNTGSVLWSTDAAPTGTWARANGTLNVRVMNRLTAPEASSSVTILVFASACEDFEFAGPRDYEVYSGNDILTLSTLTTAVAQSDVQYDDDAESHEITPVGKSKELYLQVFGEKVSSWREYLHRSSLSFVYSEVASTTSIGVGIKRLPIKRMPPAPGVYNNGFWLGTTSSGAGQRAFYTKFHPIIAIGSCFMGYKGSVNVTVNVDQPRNTTVVDTLSISRLQNGDALIAAARNPSQVITARPPSGVSVNAKTDIQTLDSGRAGIALTNTKTNAGMSAQLPYYSSAGFSLMNMYNEYNNQDILTDNNDDWWRVEWRYNKSADTTSSDGAMTSVYYSTGPDFDLVYFINVPVLNLVSVIAV